ncbi:MAG: hypothetical protein JXA71_08020 [Chitinispirillaceae bacterium]|nr:hypothetical protein [Chitinispirillaceae bacterium]
MDIDTLPPDQIASLIAKILSDRDPASVGLRRIVRKKTAEAGEFPMRAVALEDFGAGNKSSTALSEDELQIIELERQVAALKKHQAEQITKAREAVKKAYAQGYDEGHKKGRQQGSEEAGAVFDRKIEEIQQQVSACMQNAEKEKTAIYANADHALLELCRLMVKKIVSVEFKQNREAILSVLRTALSYAAQKDKLVIRVAPLDLETMKGRRDFWAPVTERLGEITLEADERIEPGGCIIESGSGVIDARVGTQLDELALVIEKAWESIHGHKNTPEADSV